MARYLLALASAIALLLAPAAWARPWEQREHLLGIDPFSGVQFRAGSSGDAVIAYNDRAGGGLYARYRPVDGAVSAPQRVGDPGGGFDLAVAGDGTAVLAWVEESATTQPRLFAAVKEGGSAQFGAPQELARSELAIFGPSAAVGGGDVLVGWRESFRGQGFRASLRVRVRESGAPGFGPAQTLAGTKAASPEAGLAADGSGFLIWALDRGLGLARRGANGAFTVQEPLATEGDTRYARPALTVSPEGRAVLATSSARPGDPNERHCVGASGSTAQGFGEAEILSGPGCRSPQVAIGPDERPVAAWRAGHGRRARVQALVGRPGNAFDTDLVQSISPPSARGLTLAASRSLAAVAWQRKVGDARQIEVATSDTDEPFGGRRRIQRIGAGSFPEAAADKRGGVWVGWSRRDGRSPAVNAAVVHAFRISRVLRVADGADLGSVLPSPFASRFGGSMLFAYADVGAEPDHLDLSVYPN